MQTSNISNDQKIALENHFNFGKNEIFENLGVLL